MYDLINLRFTRTPLAPFNFVESQRSFLQGALSVTDMASNGIKGGNITKPCDEVEFNRSALIEINKCSDKAAECITSIKPWSC